MKSAAVSLKRMEDRLKRVRVHHATLLAFHLMDSCFRCKGNIRKFLRKRWNPREGSWNSSNSENYWLVESNYLSAIPRNYANKVVLLEFYLFQHIHVKIATARADVRSYDVIAALMELVLVSDIDLQASNVAAYASKVYIFQPHCFLLLLILDLFFCAIFCSFSFFFVVFQVSYSCLFQLLPLLASLLPHLGDYSTKFRRVLLSFVWQCMLCDVESDKVRGKKRSLWFLWNAFFSAVLMMCQSVLSSTYKHIMDAVTLPQSKGESPLIACDGTKGGGIGERQNIRKNSIV